MNFNYFEEFPTKLTDAQLTLAEGCTLFLASKSYQDFLFIEQNLSVRNSKVKYAYWPIVESTYWVSPFSTKVDIERLVSEVTRDNGRHNILIDLELPILNPLRLLLGFGGFRQKKEIISVLTKNSKVYTAENIVSSGTIHHLNRLLGVSYSNKNRIIMFYRLVPFDIIFRKMRLNYLKTLIGNNKAILGIGVNSTGVLGIEKITPKEIILQDAKMFQKKFGVENFYIYQLSGEISDKKH